MADKSSFYIWQNGMCITYLLELKKMEQFFILNGWIPSGDPSEANLIVIGACASFLPYFDTYKEKIESVEPFEGKVVVYGCLPIVDKDFYKETSCNVDMFIPIGHPEQIEQIIQNPRVKWDDVQSSSQFRRSDYTDFSPDKHFIIIQEGCSEGCVYCPHKIAIGREKSREPEEIFNQVRRVLSEGAKTIIIEGENAGSWGLDLKPRRDYKYLLENILSISQNVDIHVGNFSPKWVLEYHEPLKSKQITDLKIPIQTSSSRLLKLMGRNPTVKEIEPYLKMLREENKRLTLRTEIIIGLPTETEEELLDTLEFVSKNFHKVACFSFDFHPQSDLAKMDIPLLDSTVIEKRVKIAMEYFNQRPQIEAIFDDRGKICHKVTMNAQ